MKTRRTPQCSTLDIAHEYAQRVRNQLGANAREVILFGSHARGEATSASDYDFLVIVKKRDPAVRATITDISVSMLNEHNTVCASLIYDQQQWRALRQSPLRWNIEREGVRV